MTRVVENENSHDIGAQALPAGKYQLAFEGRGQRGIRNAAVAFGVAGHADLANPAPAQDAVFQHLHRVGVRSVPTRLVAGDQHHAVHAVFTHGGGQKVRQFCLAGEAPGCDVRHRVEAGAPDRCHRG